jgi:putative transposase
VKLATRLIVEEALEGEAGDAVGRDYYEHGAQPGQGYRNGYRAGRLKTAGDDGIFGAADRRAG